MRKIALTFREFKDVEKYARVVSLDEIEKNEWSLNISKYVATANAAVKVDVGEAIARLRELECKRAEAEARMNSYLRGLGYGTE